MIKRILSLIQVVAIITSFIVIIDLNKAYAKTIILSEDFTNENKIPN